MKTHLPRLLSAALLLLSLTPAARAEEFDGRSLGIPASHNVNSVLKRADAEDKRVLVIALDPKKNGQGLHIEGMLQFEETKKLVKENFILVITDFKDAKVHSLVGKDPTDRPIYFLLKKDGTLIQKGTTAMGGNLGNQLVKSWVEKK